MEPLARARGLSLLQPPGPSPPWPPSQPAFSPAGPTIVARGGSAPLVAGPMNPPPRGRTTRTPRRLFLLSTPRHLDTSTPCHLDTSPHEHPAANRFRKH